MPGCQTQGYDLGGCRSPGCSDRLPGRFANEHRCDNAKSLDFVIEEAAAPSLLLGPFVRHFVLQHHLELPVNVLL